MPEWLYFLTPTAALPLGFGIARLGRRLRVIGLGIALVLPFALIALLSALYPSTNMTWLQDVLVGLAIMGTALGIWIGLLLIGFGVSRRLTSDFYENCYR